LRGHRHRHEGEENDACQQAQLFRFHCSNNQEIQSEVQLLLIVADNTDRYYLY
jgi:hypothetical protein